ncbi:MAG: hypothetical protein KGK16_11955, partial [Bradyrhizobium sp.]|nr:hypothetical protein [Bradyrhizobium sp.]
MSDGTRGWCKKMHRVVATGSPGSNRHSLRDGFTASFVISSVSRAFLPPSRATMRQHRGLLDISVGISSARFPKFV